MRKRETISENDPGEIANSQILIIAKKEQNLNILQISLLCSVI